MSKVLVCGAAGFLGSHVCALFKRAGWDVVGYDNLTKFELARTDYDVDRARQYNVDFLKSIGVELLVRDIRDKLALPKAAKGCDYIINCAAQPAMTVALEKPSYDASINIMGTLNILEVARRYKIPVALCSTIHVYGNGINKECYEFNDALMHNPVTISEDYLLVSGVLTPLHVSKLAMEHFGCSFIECFDSKVAIFRLTGIYGPRQFGGEDHGWVANFAIKTVYNKPITVFGTDKQVRDILYVTDAAQAFLDWYKNGQVSGVYNIGGGVPCITSIKSCLIQLSGITGNVQSIKLEPARPGDLWYFCCDTGKALKKFGWRPEVLPSEGLRNLVNWVKENKEIFGG